MGTHQRLFTSVPKYYSKLTKCLPRFNYAASWLITFLFGRFSQKSLDRGLPCLTRQYFLHLSRHTRAFLSFFLFLNDINFDRAKKKNLNALSAGSSRVSYTFWLTIQQIKQSFIYIYMYFLTFHSKLRTMLCL